MCAREDSNFHEHKLTTPSRWRVYQFHHARVISSTGRAKLGVLLTNHHNTILKFIRFENYLSNS